MDFYNLVELISNIGIIASFHTIFLEPIHVEDNFMQGYFFFLWEVSCLLKAFRISKIFMKMINYKIIIKTMTDVYPLIKDLLTLLFVAILFGSSFYMSIFGGKMNDKYKEEYDKLLTTGYNLNSNLNFNDVASSMAKVTMLIFSSYNSFLPDISFLGY